MPNELTTSSQRIAAEIRAEMARQKISINQLAEDIGMPISTLRRSVNGDRPFTLDEFWEITSSLGIKPVEVVARAEEVAA